MTARDASKWAGILEAELTRVNGIEIVRGQITTVVADGCGGRFALQWGDEVFVRDGFWSQTGASDDPLFQTNSGEFSLLLDRAKSACVALTPEEVSVLHG